MRHLLDAVADPGNSLVMRFQKSNWPCGSLGFILKRRLILGIACKEMHSNLSRNSVLTGKNNPFCKCRKIFTGNVNQAQSGSSFQSSTLKEIIMYEIP